jgi:hypothetical protein
VVLDENSYEGIEYYHDYILFSPVTSTITKGRTFKYLRWVQIFKRLVHLDEMLYEVMALNITSTTYSSVP